jgi:hypothetical protein
MQFCTRCGRPRDEGADFCVVCGNQFPGEQTAPEAETTPPGWGPAPPEPLPPAEPGWGSAPPGPVPPAEPGWGPAPPEPLPSEPLPPGSVRPGSVRPGPPPGAPPPPGTPTWGPGFPPGGPAPPPDDYAARPYGLDDMLSGGAETLTGPGGGERPRRRPPWVLIALLIVVVLGGGGTAAAFVLSGHHAAKPSAAATPTQQPTHSSAPATPSATPSATSTPGKGRVKVASSLAGNPQAPQIVALLDSYFAAINARNYQGYYALLNPQVQQQTSQSQFSKGFASTKDSRETLTGISAGPGGATVAAVTFTSHQSPANSVNGHESCTTWHISLYLQRSGNSYLIGKPPSSYRASYAAC